MIVGQDLINLGYSIKNNSPYVKITDYSYNNGGKYLVSLSEDGSVTTIPPSAEIGKVKPLIITDLKKFTEWHTDNQM